MFLHSSETKLQHPISNERLRLLAPLPVELAGFVKGLENIKFE
jgi:23S rRNA pseudouridine955/2504/2580 synthase